eukprot:CAMPEP_0182421176 /NCGR_PEP_ID=MMETSP1167-20130531/6434_1 /TAXON_ID=2988 /ORGANISM="Mallomonas Sp, Strain CCMP3275" /LENGTH=55 /DNA_ID=CAMNT_0024598039 /DNA_START=133 /DNA_END=297 /DNA_ORIENTATION=-
METERECVCGTESEGVCQSAVALAPTSPRSELRREGPHEEQQEQQQQQQQEEEEE